MVAWAAQEAELLGAFDGLILENTHDAPYLKGGVGPEIIATMTAVALALRARFAGPIGVQVLAGDNEAALAIAQAAELDFIRAEGFSFAHVADEGLIEACAGPLLRKRRAIGAESVRIFADIKKKHSAHALTADLDIAETASATEFCEAEGLIITGRSTGRPCDSDDVKRARAATSLPVLVGSGVSPEQLPILLPLADGLIVGSWLKVDGHWKNPIDPSRLEAFLKALKSWREAND